MEIVLHARKDLAIQTRAALPEVALSQIVLNAEGMDAIPAILGQYL